MSCRDLCVLSYESLYAFSILSCLFFSSAQNNAVGLTKSLSMPIASPVFMQYP